MVVCSEMLGEDVRRAVCGKVMNFSIQNMQAMMSRGGRTLVTRATFHSLFSHMALEHEQSWNSNLHHLQIW